MSQYKELADAVDNVCENGDQRDEIAAILRGLDAQEPVMVYHGRCVIDCGENGHSNVEMLKMIPAGTKLYAAPVAAQPTNTPLLVRDLAASLFVQPLAVCEALKEFGFGNFSVNMAVPADAVKVIESKFAQPQQAKPEPLSDAEILGIAEPFGAFEFGDAQGDKRLAFARAAITAFCQKNGIKEQG